MAYERSNRIRFKDSILERTAKAVKEAQALSFGEDGEQIDICNEDRALQRLAEQLDHIFLHGLRHVTPGYWAFVQQYTHRDITQEIKALDRLSTDLGRSRAWLYKALNDSALESFFNCFLGDQANVKKHYIDLALLRDKERLSLLLTLISGLDFVSFKLELNVAFFDLVSHVPRSATERQSSLDTISLHSYDSETPASTPVTATPEDGNSEVFQSFSSKCSRQTSLQDELILKKVNEGQLPVVAPPPTRGSEVSLESLDGSKKPSGRENGKVKKLSLPERPTTLALVKNVNGGGGEARQGEVVYLKDKKRRSKKRRSSKKEVPSTSGSTSPSVRSGIVAHDGVQELLDATVETLQGQISNRAGESVRKKSDGKVTETDANGLCESEGSGGISQLEQNVEQGAVVEVVGGKIRNSCAEIREGAEIRENGGYFDSERNTVNCGNDECSEGTKVTRGFAVEKLNCLEDRTVLNNNVETGAVCKSPVVNSAIAGIDRGSNSVRVKDLTGVNRSRASRNGNVGQTDDIKRHSETEHNISAGNRGEQTQACARKSDKERNYTSENKDCGTRNVDGPSYQSPPTVLADRSLKGTSEQGPLVSPIVAEEWVPEGTPSSTNHPLNDSLDGHSYESLFAQSSEVFAGVQELKSPGDGVSETESEGKEPKNDVATPGTIKIDSNTKLHLMLEVFVHSEEKYLELFQVSSNHNQGEVRPGLLLLSTFAVYLLRNSEKKKRYKAQVRIPLEDLDSISMSMNSQILFIVFNSGKRKKTLVVCTGDEALSKAILAHLTSACKESSTFPPSIEKDASQHHLKLTGWAAKECRHSNKTLKLYHYSLIHWDDAVDSHGDPDMSVYKPIIYKAGHLSYRTKESMFLGSFWQPGFFELKDCILSRYSQKGANKVQWSLQLSPPDFTGCRRLRQRDRGHCFEILQSKGPSYVMSCGSERQLSSWLAAICQVMAEQQSLQACSPTGTPVQPCCSLVTSQKLLLFHEDSQTSFIRCLASCDVASITCLRSAEKEPNFVIVDFLPEESETPWIFYFFSWMEAVKFQTALSASYYESVQTVLPLRHLADSRLKQRTRTCLTAIRASKNNKTAAGSDCR